MKPWLSAGKGSASSFWQTTTFIRFLSRTWLQPSVVPTSGILRVLTALRQERFELMAQLEQLPDDMVFLTQITMEAAEDPEFLAAMRRARIRGALVGVESVTPEGLKAVFKNFNDAGEALVERLQAFRSQGVHVLGSFIFGLPTDNVDTFDATADLAQRSGVSFAQFVMLTPFPGTVDFAKWEQQESGAATINGVPLTRYWLIPPSQRPKVYAPHPDDVGRRDSKRYPARLGPFLRVVGNLEAFNLRAIAPCPHRLRVDFKVVSTDVCQHRNCHRQRPRGAIGPARALARQGRAAAVHRGTDAESRRSHRGIECFRSQAVSPAHRFLDRRHPRHTSIGGPACAD